MEIQKEVEDKTKIIGELNIKKEALKKIVKHLFKRNKNYENIINELERKNKEIQNKLEEKIKYIEIIKEYIKLKKDEIENLKQINKNEKNKKKNKILDLQNKLDNINNIKSNYDNIIKNLEKIINEKENNLISKNEMMCINFISIDSTLHYSIPCVNSDIFAEIEEKLYKKFPKYRGINNYFLYKGKAILKLKTIAENKIESGMPITLWINYE